MFAELQDLLKKRSLVLTLVASDGDTIRVTVNPKPKDKDEPKALSTPFVLEGTAAELDEGFAVALAEFKTTHNSLEVQIAAIKAEADEAVKAPKKEAADKVKAASGSTAAAKVKKPEPTTVAPKQPEPELSLTRGLFDPLPASTAETPAQAEMTPAQTVTDSDPTITESEVKEGTAHGVEALAPAA